MKTCWENEGLTIYSSSDLPLDERMYTLVCGHEVLVVDPNCDEEIVEFLKELGIKGIRIILTHSHYDHITGVNLLRKNFDCTVISTTLCKSYLPDPRKNMSRYASIVYNGHGWKTEDVPKVPRISCYSDVGFEKSYELEFGMHSVRLLSIGGHSEDGLMMWVDDRLLFTGDNLIPDTATVLNLPGGDADTYWSKVVPYLRSLPGETIIFPGHGNTGLLKDILRSHPDYN